MKKTIVDCSIENLKQDGLKFSIDEIAKELKISKKTIYKYFPNKEALAEEIYATYFNQCLNKAKTIIEESKNVQYDLLSLYYESFKIVDDRIFNKFILNNNIYKTAIEEHCYFWLFIEKKVVTHDSEVTKLIIDASFKEGVRINLDNTKVNELIEKIMTLL